MQCSLCGRCLTKYTTPQLGWTPICRPAMRGLSSLNSISFVMQPLRQVFDEIHDATAAVGTTTRVLLAGDERGHVPEHLEEADAAMRDVVAARCVPLCIQKLQPRVRHYACRYCGQVCATMHMDIAS